MATYTTKQPHYTRWQWFKFIAVRLVIPAILAWDFLKLGINAVAGQFFGSIVLPAQDRKDYPKIELLSMDLLIKHNILKQAPVSITYEKITIKTYDLAELDGLEIKHRNQITMPTKDQTYIINFIGNVMAYEQIIYEMQSDALQLKCNVIGFNFRGVNGSKGRATSKDNLVTDGIAQVQRLLDLGVSSSHITLKGHSIGSAVGTLVAHHFHQQGQPINLFSGRSFSSLTNVAVGMIRTGFNGTGHLETTSGKVLGCLAKPIIKLVLTLVNWEMEAGDAFKAIPKDYKEYILVRTKKADRKAWVVDDHIITHYASIHTALKSERREVKNAIKANHVVHAMVTLNQTKAKFSDRKMIVHTAANVSGHNYPLKGLSNRSNVYANHFFRQFVTNRDKHHTEHQSISLGVGWIKKTASRLSGVLTEPVNYLSKK